MNVQVVIDRLIVEGVPISAAQRPLVQAALEAELARLLALGGVAPALAVGGAVPHLGAPSIQLSRDASPSTLGKQIARSVYEGIGQ